MKASIALAGAACVAAVALPVVFGGQAAPAPTPPALRPAPTADVSAPPVASAPAPLVAAHEACDWRAGRQLAYRVSTEGSAALQLPSGKRADVDAELTALLRLRLLRVQDGVAVAVGQLSELKSRVAGLAAAELGAPFLIELDAGCRLRRFAGGVQVPRAHARDQQALLWSALFAATPGPLSGQDGLGEFTAEMTARADGQLERVVRTYDALWGTTALDVPATGRTVIKLGRGPWFDTLQARTQLTVDGVPTTSRTTFDRTAAPALEVAAELADFVWEELLGATVHERAVRPDNAYDAARRARVAALSYEQALTTFAARCAQESSADAWRDLSAWFEVHPEGVRTAVEQLRARDVPPQAVAWLYTALGKARVPQAREALLAIRRDTTEPPMDRVRATFNLLDREDVGVPLARELGAEGAVSMAELDHEASFLRGEALLALGMMAGLRADPAIDAVARDTLRSILTTAPRDAQVARSALKAVGNLGDATLLPAAQRFMEAPNFHSRRAAAHVFRRMAPRDAEAAALAWLAREENPFVKRELYVQLRRQHFDAQARVSAALTRQAMADLRVTKAPIDRKTIIRFLSRSVLVDTPELRRFLVEQATLERQRDSGILNVFTEILTPAEVSEVLR